LLLVEQLISIGKSSLFGSLAWQVAGLEFGGAGGTTAGDRFWKLLLLCSICGGYVSPVWLWLRHFSAKLWDGLCEASA